MRLRSAKGPQAARKVTWLELFFDLVFVAAVAQVAEPLHHHYTAHELIRLAPLLTLIWWAWTGHSFFSTRFDTDDHVQRVLTFVQMFVVAVMAANAKDTLDSRSTAGLPRLTPCCASSWWRSTRVHGRSLRRMAWRRVT